MKWSDMKMRRHSFSPPIYTSSGAVLNVWDTAVNGRDKKVSAFKKFIRQWEDTNNSKSVKYIDSTKCMEESKTEKHKKECQEILALNREAIKCDTVMVIFR